MNHQKEISIRVSSPLLFIDDDAPSPDASLTDTFQSLTVVKRKTDKLSNDVKNLPVESMKKQQFELTIRGDNTIINIQTITKSPRRETRSDDKDGVYEFISDRVQEIFHSPGKEEIEKAFESVEMRDGAKERLFTKKGTWKMLSRSARATQQKRLDTEVDRYPSMVLLQDPPDTKEDEETYPKMIMLGETLEKPKFDIRSKSMLNLPALNELNEERHAIEMHRSLLEKEKINLERIRDDIEKGRSELLKNRTTLERTKSFIVQDKSIIKDKKQVLQEEKATQNLGAPDRNFLRKEKLCLEMEKQLLEDEKKIINEEQNILGQEREIIEKEKSILGGEKSVLEEERAILGKEKFVLEKQQSFLSEGMCRREENRDSFNQSDEGMSEIEDVFEEAYQLGKSCRGHLHPPRSTPLPHCSSSCGFNTPYPMYVPVYSLPRPYAATYRPPSLQPKRTKSIQTQTMPTPGEADIEAMPFGLLPGFFPRVLITSMNSTYPNGAEDNSRHSKITEIPLETTAAPKPPISIPPAAPTKPKRKHSKKVVKPSTQSKVGNHHTKSLKLPQSDLSLRAKSVPKPKHQNSAETEADAEESGIQTLTTDSATKDDVSATSDETITFETIHFGNCDDFYSNDAIFPDKATKGEAEEKAGELSTKKLPLTHIGYDMFAKLTELTTENEPKAQEPVPKADAINNKFEDRSIVNVNLHLTEADVEFTLPGNLTFQVKTSRHAPYETRYCHGMPRMDSPCCSHADTDNGRSLVRRSDLWHADQHTKPHHLQYCCNKQTSYQHSPDLVDHFPGEQRKPNLQFNVNPRGMENTRKNEKQQGDNFSLFIGNATTCACEREEKFQPPTHCKAATRSQLSPRTADLLGELRSKLELAQSERNIVAFGKSGQMDKSPAELDGLYYVKHFPGPDKSAPKKVMAPRNTNREKAPREYLCEECLTTMRLYEDDFQSVQNIVDKFEHMGRAKRH